MGPSAGRLGVRLLRQVRASVVVLAVSEYAASAHFSPDRVYRYTLARRWGSGPSMNVIGLNPSTADETVDDPTIRRCISFARREGCDALIVTNLFAYRATDPREMRRAADPIGEHNDAWIVGVARVAHVVVLAWGAGGAYRDRAADVSELLAREGIRVRCLGTTRDGAPRHPLYLTASTPLVARGTP